LEQTRQQAQRPLSVKNLMVFGLWVMAALPFVGAIAVTDDLRSGALVPEMAEPQE
jgi:hypothetical protein